MAGGVRDIDHFLINCSEFERGWESTVEELRGLKNGWRSLRGWVPRRHCWEKGRGNDCSDGGCGQVYYVMVS